jgi:hypothetical protein
VVRGSVARVSNLLEPSFWATDGVIISRAGRQNGNSGQSQVSRERTLMEDTFGPGAHRERNHPCTTFPTELLVQRSLWQQ